MTQLEFNNLLGSSGNRFALAVTGSGMTGATDFFRTSGASLFIDEVRIPYSYQSSRRLCGWTMDDPRKVVCEETAIALARGIWKAHYDWRDAPENGIGIGMTGKLIQYNERIGREHEIWVAAYVHRDQAHFHNKSFLTERLVPTPGSRAEQESQASRFLHQFMVQAAEQVRR